MVRYVSDVARYTEIHITFYIHESAVSGNPLVLEVPKSSFYCSDLQTMLHRPCVDVSMINLSAKFICLTPTVHWLLSSNLKLKKNVYMSIMLSFYILPKYFFNKCSTFFQVLLPYKFQYKVSNPSIMPAS